MKYASFSEIRLKSPLLLLLSFFLLTTTLFSLTFVRETSAARQQQQARLSLADILIALRSKKVTLDERNRLLTDAVQVRGITFALTPEIETELKATGASDELVEAIRRQKSPVNKIASSTPTQAITPSAPSITASATTTVTPTPTPMPVPSLTTIAAVQTPAPIQTPAPPDFAFYRKRADESIARGDYESAVGDYNKAVELNPSDTSAYLNRGLAFFNRKDYARAIADYDKAIELNPREAMYYFNRGNAHERAGSLQKAVADYQKAVELDAGTESAKLALQRIQMELSRTSPAKTNAPVAGTSNAVSTAAATAATATALKVGQLTAEKAVSMAMPSYPANAKKFGIQGTVTVEVTFDEKGSVVAVRALDGHQILRGASEDAARRSKFKPVLDAGRPARATGFIIYNFKAN